MKQKSTVQTRNQSSSQQSQDMSRFAVPAIAVLGILGLLTLLHPKPNNTPQTSPYSPTAQDPRYGFRDLEVHEPQTRITLRDNADEDGDFVTFSVNGRVYLQNTMLHNAGQTVQVALNPGPNLVKIYGERDGGGGVTLAADVSGFNNVNNAPFSQGATAYFYIIRR